jgi:ATP-dependent DNA ligase
MPPRHSCISIQEDEASASREDEQLCRYNPPLCFREIFDLLFLDRSGPAITPTCFKEKNDVEETATAKTLSNCLPRLMSSPYGRLFFDQIVRMDLERIVCKRKDSQYKATERPSRYWIKVKNRDIPKLDRT